MIQGGEFRVTTAPDAFVRAIGTTGFCSDDEAVLGAGFQTCGDVLLVVVGEGLDDFTGGIVADVFGVFTHADDLAVAYAFCPTQVGCGVGYRIHIKV